MANERIEGKWLDAFGEVFEACGVKRGEVAAILSETQSRAVTVQVAELALHALGARAFHLVMPAPRGSQRVRVAGSNEVLAGLKPVLAALEQSELVVDLTLEGLIHAREMPGILAAGARILQIGDQHPEGLERLRPEPALEEETRHALRGLRAAGTMSVTSAAGTDLTIDLREARSAGNWGWTTRPGTLARWPGGLVLAFPSEGTVDGVLVLDRGDGNLALSRYLEGPVRLILERDQVVAVEGEGTDAALVRAQLIHSGERSQCSVRHIGWGLNRRARYDALRPSAGPGANGSELRTMAGSLLFGAGANAPAGRHAPGHFEFAVMRTTIDLDGRAVVQEGVLCP